MLLRARSEWANDILRLHPPTTTELAPRSLVSCLPTTKVEVLALSYLERIEVLTWEMQMCEAGYTCHQLRDTKGVRWGWIINAGGEGWTAHVGDWGQASSVGQKSPGLLEVLHHFDRVGDGKNWVEEMVAKSWKTMHAEQKGLT